MLKLNRCSSPLDFYLSPKTSKRRLFDELGPCLLLIRNQRRFLTYHGQPCSCRSLRKGKKYCIKWRILLKISEKRNKLHENWSYKVAGNDPRCLTRITVLRLLASTHGSCKEGPVPVEPTAEDLPFRKTKASELDDPSLDVSDPLVVLWHFLANLSCSRKVPNLLVETFDLFEILVDPLADGRDHRPLVVSQLRGQAGHVGFYLCAKGLSVFHLHFSFNRLLISSFSL